MSLLEAPQHASIAALSTCAVAAVLHVGKSLRFRVLEERDSVWHLRVSFLVAMSVCAIFMKRLKDKIYMKIYETWDQNPHMCFKKRVCRYSRACSISSLCFKGMKKKNKICLVVTSIAISGSWPELNFVPDVLNRSLWLSPLCKYFLQATCYQLYSAASVFQPQAKCPF